MRSIKYTLQLIALPNHENKNKIKPNENPNGHISNIKYFLSLSFYYVLEDSINNLEMISSS